MPVSFRTWMLRVLGPCLLALVAVAARAQAPALLEQSFEFSIPAQKVSTAVIELSRQAAIQVLMSGKVLDGFETTGLEGRLSLRDALDRLLVGTPYIYRQTDEGTITIDTPTALAAMPEYAPGAGVTAAPVETIPLAAHAESAPVAPPAENADAQRLDDVEVTATKRSQSLREIPASIASLDGGDLERRGAQGMEDIVRVVPGVNIATENGIQRVTIRGIAAANNTNATTGTLFGNVSFIDSYLPVMSLDPQPFDLKSVEVLKGPQGTLFGASALNGAIRYVPEPPEFGVFTGKYFAQYTTVAEGDTGWTYGAAVNLPVGETVALRLTAFDRNSPGWVDNLRTHEADTNSRTQRGLRGILGWQPDEDWNFSLIYATQDTATYDTGLTDNLDGRLSSNERPRRGPDSNTYDLVGLNIERTYDWAQLVSETAYVKKHSRTFLENSRQYVSSIPLFGIEGGGDTQTWSQEFRLVSPDDPGSRWRWITGVFASRQQLQTRVNLALGNGQIPPALYLDFLNNLIPGLGDLVDPYGNLSLILLTPDITVEEIAFFGDVTRKLGENWELTLGGRLYKTRSFGTNTQRGAVFTALNLNPQHVESGGVDEKSFNPKASLSWRATDNIMSYATVSKGYRVGGLQPGFTFPTSRTQAPPTFKSDTIWNYEAGVRTEWLDRTLNLDVTAFYIDWQNPQTQQYESTLNLVYLDNVGAVKSTGVDLALRWITPIGVMINASASRAETVITQPFQAGNGNTAPPGTSWPYAPKLQTATTISYPLVLGDWQLPLSVTHTYQGKTVNDLGGQKPIFDYQQLDAQVGLESTAILWLPRLDLTLNNLLDERGLTSHIKQGNTIDTTYSQPRTLILRLSGTF